MAAYYDFTSTRTTVPDYAGLLIALRNAVAPELGMQMLDGKHFMLKKAAEWTAAEISAAQSQIDTYPALTPQLTAQHTIDSWPIEVRALLLTLLDQINVLRTRAGLVTVTPAQAIQAVRDKAATLQ